MEYIITGEIQRIGNAESFGSKGFTKRELIVRTDDKYPQDLKIEFHKDACSKLDKFQEMQKVNVSVNIRGSEYNGKNYVSLVGWKIEADEKSYQPEPKRPHQPSGNDDDIPF